MKFSFKKSSYEDHGTARQPMGAAGGAFSKARLSEELKTSIRLAFHLFGTLDRQIISAMEVSLNLNASHREGVRRIVGEISNRKESLPEIIKPYRNATHHMRYRIFGDFCKIAAGHQRYDMGFIQKIISIGKAMDLSEDELYRWIKQAKLAE